MDKRTLPFLGLGLIFLVVTGVLVVSLALGALYIVRPARAALTELDPNDGLIVLGLDPEGPAAGVSIVRGDILLRVEGDEMYSRVDLSEALEGSEPGETVELTLLHGDELRDVMVTLDEREGQPYLGLHVCCGQGDPQGFGQFPTQPGEFPPGLVPGRSGALILEVIPGSPADEAGLRAGDTVTGVDGLGLIEQGDLAAAIATFEPGEEVTLEVERPGEAHLEITVILGENPDQADAPYLGVRYQPRLRFQFFGEDGIPFDELPHDRQPFDFGPFQELPDGHPPIHPDEGFSIPEAGTIPTVVVREVIEGTPAEAAGLNEGDIIVAIDGEEVADPAALIEKLGDFSPGDEVTLSVWNPEEDVTRELVIELGKHPEDEDRAYLGIILAGGLRLEVHPEWDEFDFERFLPRFFEGFPDRDFQFRFHFPDTGPCLEGECDPQDA